MLSMGDRLLGWRCKVIAFLPLIDVGSVIWSSGMRLGPRVLLGHERPTDWSGLSLGGKVSGCPRFGVEHALRWGLRLLGVEVKRGLLRDGEG